MSNTLVVQNNNTGVDVKRISSREVAEMMEVRHNNLIRKIDKINTILLNSKLSTVKYWIESTFKDNSGKSNREYLISKEGCEFLAHKSTGEKGILFTHRYMERFKEMEQIIEQGPQQVITAEQIVQMVNEAVKTAIAPLIEKLTAPKEAPKTRTANFRTLPTVTKIAKPFGMTGTDVNKILEENGIIRRSDNGKGSILNEEYEDRWGTTIYEDGKEPYVRYFDLGVNSITKIFSRIINASEQEQLNLF